MSASPSTESLRTVHGACPHDCPDTCALQVQTDGQRVIKVSGRADHASTHGALCTKVSRYPERTHHPERLLTPLKRVSAKTEPPRFETVSWEAALADIATRLNAIAARDPQAIQPYSYAGTMGLLQGGSMADRLWNRLGAARLERTICASAGAEALNLTYGSRVGMHLRFFAESKLILIWGSNSIASNLHFWTYANQAKRAGAKLVCIDPRRSETADKCHQHLALRPGSDGALALALMHELIRHDWLDHDYLARHVEGWPGLRERALQWPPERAAALTGLNVAEIEGLARDYGQTAPAAIRLNYGMQRVRGGGNAVRLIALLPCLVGAWKHRAGGLLLSSSGWVAPYKNNEALERPDLLAGRQPRSVNMSAIGDALLDLNDPPIQALVVYNSNPAAVAPDSGRVIRGLQRADLFTVVIEHFLTDTADLADYVLPATTQMEHLDVHASYGHTDVLINEPAIAPLGQAKPNTQIFRELALAMGFDEPWVHEDDEALARMAFFAPPDAADAASPQGGGPPRERPSAGPGIPFDALREQGFYSLPLPEAPFADGSWPTPNGKVWAAHPQAGVPDFVPNQECAETDSARAVRYPLAMISPPARNFLNSSFVNVKSLRDIEREPLLEMHAQDAAARGLQDGQMVRVFNARGEQLLRLALNGRARPGVVNGLGVWWRKFGVDGKNVNELTHQGLTDIGAGACFYDCLVEVTAA
ncbi:anaerobic selenocysteine-containing dehydrogenase [Inhella inkyongensis]|uniref:Anaerobic selenocysteine-containing dehydrogenase n=1 Tax=Inhella inkyongensis TaxID=392593 RepID=A0A840S595_9BURK|nr:molybdopterin oxidoreductase family protein [Inhella inkyongensis]MBB5204648.1 anaerobic selenocysteine-containing dehydrogenase [Inhella inkyongensis]